MMKNILVFLPGVQGVKNCQIKKLFIFGYLNFYSPNFSQHFENNEKNPIFTPLLTGVDCWVRVIENFIFEKLLSCFCL